MHAVVFRLALAPYRPALQLVQADCAAALSAALVDAIARGPMGLRDRVVIHDHAIGQISATRAAERFMSFLNHEGRPSAATTGVES